MREKEEVYAYVGIKSCGCTVAAFVDKPEYKKDIAKEVASWIRDGWRVDRVLCDNLTISTCKCEEPEPETLPLFDEATK